MIKKSVAMVISICVFCSLMPNTLSMAEGEPNLTGLTTFTFNGDNVTVAEGSSDNYEVVVYDDTDTESDCITSTDESGNTVYSIPSNVSGQLLVSIKKKGGEYVFQGSGNGSIAVKKEATDDAVLYLNGLDLTSTFTSVLTVKKDSTAKCTVYVVNSTENTLIDNISNNEEKNTSNAAAENAVMKFKDASDVTITGGGTLNIEGNAKNGIKSNNILTIDGDVNLNISAPDNGISSDNSITINSATISIIADEGDGIKASPDETTESTDDTTTAGNILINEGKYNITSGGDGIQADGDLIIYNGDFSITSGGGHLNKTASDANSCKGLKAGSYLSIYNGTYNIDSADDTIHSNEYVYMIAGDYTISTGDDGVHSDTSLIVGEEDNSDDNLNINILDSYEGLESGTVYIYSGSIEISSSDDGINSAGGSSNGFNDQNGDHFRPGGGGGIGPNGGFGSFRPDSSFSKVPESSQNDYSINIYGGNIDVNAEGDGLDSNGNIEITAGEILVYGAASNGYSTDNSALDWETTCVISGGLVLAAGSSQMAMPPSNGSQPYIIYRNNVSKGKAINVLNENGEPVYSTFAIKQVNHIIYSSESASGYTFRITDDLLINDPDSTNPTSDTLKPSGSDPSDSSNKPSNQPTQASSNPTGLKPSPVVPAKTTRNSAKVQKERKNAEKIMNQAKIIKLTVKSKAKKKIVVKWKKVNKAKGYEIQVCKKRNFKKNILDKFTSKKKLTLKNPKIKSKKTYFVRVRAYSTYKDTYGNPQKVYSSWNKKLRKVKVK